MGGGGTSVTPVNDDKILRIVLTGGKFSLS